jgi:hypothetical protein
MNRREALKLAKMLEAEVKQINSEIKVKRLGRNRIAAAARRLRKRG